MQSIPFHTPSLSGKEIRYIRQALSAKHLCGHGAFTQRCHAWLEDCLACPKALLTQSCTAALEMAALLAGIGPGDEVILPSYTFVSTANAFVLQGGVPVFVDISPDSLNLDPSLVARAVTRRTKAIVAVHYGGLPCRMDDLSRIAEQHGLLLIEDAAQALLSTFQGKPAGTLGDLACFSFHATKNVVCGEGGALIVNRPALIERAEILWEKGTDRSQFLRGQVDKYSWMDVGSSFLPSEITAAFLLAQLEQAQEITRRRKEIWSQYHRSLEPLSEKGLLKLQAVSDDCQTNGHLFCIRLAGQEDRDALAQRLKARGISAVTHYVPLHSSPAGTRFGRAAGRMDVTDQTAGTLLRLPLFADLSSQDIRRVCACVESFLTRS
jgi:dTDP-4-amino-4,6-dideoxygalactose transaminase